MYSYHIKLLTLAFLISCAFCENKYSQKANEKKTNEVDFRKLEKPFRMNKLNILWTKAQLVSFYYALVTNYNQKVIKLQKKKYIF